MGQFDQTARPLAKMAGSAFFTWALHSCPPAPVWTFQRWDDTRRLVCPGEPERTNDLVALLDDASDPSRPVWTLAEIEEQPEKGILYRLGQYELTLGKEVNPDGDPQGPRIASVLINLTGEQRIRSLDWSWNDKGTRLAPFIVDVANQDGPATLSRIETGELGLSILPYIVLMRDGSDPNLVEQWLRLAEREPDMARRVQYRDAVLVFSELTGSQVDWLRHLEGWQMRESQYIKRWEKIGEDRGTLQRAREYLLKRVRRLQDPVPEPIRLAIEGTNDLTILDRWFDAALDADSISQIRQAMKLAP